MLDQNLKILSSPNDSATLTEFRNGAYGRPWTEVLVCRGYVVIVIDALYFGERRLRIEDLNAARVFPEMRDRLALARRPPTADIVAAGIQTVTGGSALVLTLDPGAYTLRVAGTGTTTGVALVEVYLLP